MESFLVRWTKDDLRQDMPRRLKRALQKYGGERASVLRAILREFVEEVEKRGPSQIRSAVMRVAERPEKEYTVRKEGDARKWKRGTKN